MAKKSLWKRFRSWAASKLEVAEEDDDQKQDNTQVTTWKSYVRLQGFILFSFLLGGGALASLPAGITRLGNLAFPPKGTSARGLALKEYRGLDPSKGTVIEDYIGLDNVAGITMLTRVGEPQNGAAVVMLEGFDDKTGAAELKRFESTSASWLRWEQKNTFTRVRVHVEPPAGGNAAATKVDVILLFNP
jgi:hypothetical protein